MMQLRNRLMKWVNALSTYPRVYSLMAFTFRATLAPYFFRKNKQILSKFQADFKAHQSAGRKVVVIGLDKPSNLNFLRDMVALLQADVAMHVYFANLAPELADAEIAKITNAQEIIPFGVLPFCNPDVFVTAKSTLFWNRPKGGFLVHTFHSPISLHQVYSEGSFQGFDVFFANGPHQRIELQTYMARRKQSNYQVFDVGSEVIDRYYNQKLPFEKLEHLVYGPSWGPTSSVRIFGTELIASVLHTGVKLTFRPHPVSLLHDKQWVDEICERFKDHPNFEFFDIGKGGGIAPETDGLISDWSGVAFEFALGYEKPVFFIDTPQKILNANWKTYHPNPGVEVTYRPKIGRLAFSPAELAQQILEVQQQPSQFQKVAQEAYAALVYNRGQAGASAYHAIRSLLKV